MSHSPKFATVTRLPRTHASERLRALLCESGLTQEQAGALVGVQDRQVRRWLNQPHRDRADLLVELENLVKERKAA